MGQIMIHMGQFVYEVSCYIFFVTISDIYGWILSVLTLYNTFICARKLELRIQGSFTITSSEFSNILLYYFTLISDITGNTCVGPDQFDNGMWHVGLNPQTVYYSCNPGYKLNGPMKQLCLDNGVRDPPETPICIGKPRYLNNHLLKFNNKYL